MTQFFERAIRARARIAKALGSFWERRARGLEALKRKEMEAERIDRLRNPGNYHGR